MITVKIVPNDTGNPPGKLADAELHFGGLPCACHQCNGMGVARKSADEEFRTCDQCGGSGKRTDPLAGLKLIGFAVWERRGGGGRHVTFPARQYSVNGERRSFALLRPIAEPLAQEPIRDLILGAYAEYESQVAEAR